MEGLLRAFPSTTSRPDFSVLRRCNSFSHSSLFRRAGTRLSPFGPVVKLRSISVLIRGESTKLSVPSKITNDKGIRSNGDYAVQSVEVTDTEVPVFSFQTLGLPNTDISASLESRNSFLHGLKGFYSSLLWHQSLSLHLFRSRLILQRRDAKQNSLLSFAKNFGRVLLMGMILVALEFSSGKLASRQALAAPVASRTRTIERAKVVEEETLEDNLEDVSVADGEQLDAKLASLRQEANVLREKVDFAVGEFLAAQDKLKRVRGDVLHTEKEEFLKEKEDTLVGFRNRLLVMVASLTKISERMKELDSSRQAGREQDPLSKLVTDLDKLKSTFREQDLIIKAARVSEEADSLVQTKEDMAIAQQIEREQFISDKLREVSEMLVARIDDPESVDEAELDKNMSELRVLVLDDSRWQYGDEDQLTDILEGRDSNKPLSQEEQVEILATRDRLMTMTWYNEKKGRWEMEPSAALLAVQKNLAGRARIRQDYHIMYLSLKGDDREYAVNTKAFNAEYEDVGGFRTLYLKLIASGVPTSVEMMWIPFEEWHPERLIQLPFKLVYWLLYDFYHSDFVSSVRPWYTKTLVGAFEEVMIRFGFPTIQTIVPREIRVNLGFELAEGAEAAEPTNIIMWQQEAQKHVDARYAEGSGSWAWWISLPFRCYVVGLPLLIVLQYVVGFALRPFRPQRLKMSDVEWKEKKQEELIKKLELQTKKQTIDPIKDVFDKMKRVRRPEVRLKDFAGIDVIKEEINEIISFLKNPKLFKEMGARPPRGVLIVGESGTGKTTLALAIAAEARVPMVELQGSELEGGAWVGQGASNVRELFKTARELAPLIIFMDDFDHFAGVRGATSDTRKQDHESLINQLLVELDGFETQEGVVLVATTSRPYAIDEALRRPGRMDRTIQLPMPNKKEREQILRQSARKSMDANLVDLVDWTKVAEKTAGLTPAHLKYVPEGLEGNAVSFKIADEEELFFMFLWLVRIHRVSPRWLRESKFTKKWNDMLVDWLGLRVTKADLDDAVEYLDVYGESRPGLELYDPEPMVWTRDFKHPHAVWAVGKALIALLLPDFDTVDMVWLDPTSWDGIAFTKFTKKLDGGYGETGTLTRSYCEKELVSYFGSFVASRMLLKFGENNSLCKAELKNAEELATRMVMEYGWAPDGSPMIYITDGSSATLSMGDKHEKEVADKINRLFFSASEKASQMLERNRHVLEAMLEQLIDADVLNMQDMTSILNEKGAIWEEAPFSLVPFTDTEIVSITTNGTGRSGRESSITATV